MPEIYISFFMFTADLQPDKPAYTNKIIEHMKKLCGMGYTGFDLPIAPTATTNHQAEVDSYRRFKDALDKAKLGKVSFTTNVGATRTFDPSSMYQEQRNLALAYLKSRVEITSVLGAKIMAGPIILPYGVFPTTDGNQPIWSDELQEWLSARYANAEPILEKLIDCAEKKDVKVAIEPVDHWETPAPNMVGNVIDFVKRLRHSAHIGVCIDSAHVVLGSDGPTAFTSDVARALDANQLNYVHISAPDRGAVHDSWIPWSLFLDPIKKGYTGPYLVEVFNAIPVFLNSLRLTRRKFWIPGEDDDDPSRPSAYEIALRAIAKVRAEL